MKLVWAEMFNKNSRYGELILSLFVGIAEAVKDDVV